MKSDKLIKSFANLHGRIGILGGTFDPPHSGHLTIAALAHEKLSLDWVILVPNRGNPLKDSHPIASDEQRLQMVIQAARFHDFLFVSDIEVRRNGPSYTVDTLKAIKEGLPKDSSLFFIIGSDSLQSLHLWHHYKELLSLASLATIARRDFPYERLHELTKSLSVEFISNLKNNFIQSEYIDISSTNLREALKVAPPWPEEIPEEVLNYIQEQGLYRDI